MKKFFIISILLYSMSNLFSQPVSVKLSLKWTKEETSFGKYSLERKAYLNITYSNNSPVPLYFLKVSESINRMPQLCRTGMTIKRVENLDDLEILPDYSKDKYRVIISGAPFHNTGWEVLNYEDIYEMEHMTAVIGDVLDDFYQIILKSGSLLYEDYDSSAVNEDGILKRYKDNFVFLKSGDKFVDKYDLTGFQFLGGSYEFDIRPQDLKNFVYTEPAWNEKQKKWIYPESLLPIKINEYSLYSGKFETNTVTFHFKTKKFK